MDLLQVGIGTRSQREEDGDIAFGVNLDVPGIIEQGGQRDGADHPRRVGFAQGRYDRRPDDGLELVDCRLTNAVRCVPPENKPLTEEIKTCQDYLISELGTLPRLRAVLALGTIEMPRLLRSNTLGIRRMRLNTSNPAGTRCIGNH